MKYYFCLFLASTCCLASCSPSMKPLTPSSWSVSENISTWSVSENLPREKITFKGTLNGTSWEGKSIFNPPPYYKYGSRMMMSPDRPIFKMGFQSMSDTSTLSFDLLGELKVGKYTGSNLDINVSNEKGTTRHAPDDTLSDAVVEITSYTENGNSGVVSGKISGTIRSAWKDPITIEWTWIEAKIDIWGEEAK